jgi:hypothetical protein
MPKRSRKKPPDDPLDPYKQVRKPMPPPERVDKDKRRKMERERAKREMDDDR